eukprot:6213632-Pleurochrysis_carterae.AAC.3
MTSGDGTSATDSARGNRNKSSQASLASVAHLAVGKPIGALCVSSQFDAFTIHYATDIGSAKCIIADTSSRGTAQHRFGREEFLSPNRQFAQMINTCVARLRRRAPRAPDPLREKAGQGAEARGSAI